ncbi:hypothetical protein [Spirosoma terrae]|uniref:Uncharacterized protein n=1 Tax=Spirosoma terrae TaxID=1968276 RepID=A0A6L9L8U1_9BACT|nr:hypothetical protein [Spirosoma terrae]NDU96984.1 hypothetical protein [Spirosoma terrae]
MTNVNYLFLTKAYSKALQSSPEQDTFYQFEKDWVSRRPDKLPPNIVRADRQQSTSVVAKKHSLGLDGNELHLYRSPLLSIGTIGSIV